MVSKSVTLRAKVTALDLRTRPAPVLSDGVVLSELINFEKYEVSMRSLSDPEIFRLELRGIFAKAWVGLGHESEIPKLGDFVVRQIGLDPVIVTRGPAGEVSALLNACSHRGMEVCWADAGNARRFKCPYHGWTFDTSGRLVGAPLDKTVYGDGWNKDAYGLAAARVAVRHGVIFATFDPDAPPLEEFLDGSDWYMEQMFSNAEWEPVGNVARSIVNCNWKVFADQIAGDAYHSTTLHRAMGDLGLRKDVSGNLNHVQVSFPDRGHSIFTFNLGYSPGEHANTTGDLIDRTVRNDYSWDTIGQLVMLAFPSTILSGHQPVNLPDGTAVPMVQVGQLLVHGPDKCELLLRPLVPKGTPQGAKDFVGRQLMLFGAFTGIDDTAQGTSMQKIARGEIGGRQPLRYFNIGGASDLAAWPGPGVIYAGASRDDSQWDFWTHWYDRLTQEDL